MSRYVRGIFCPNGGWFYIIHLNDILHVLFAQNFWYKHTWTLNNINPWLNILIYPFHTLELCKCLQRDGLKDVQLYQLLIKCITIHSLQWRRNEHDGVSNYLPHFCLPNHLSRRRTKKISKIRVTDSLCGEFTGDRWIPRTKTQLRRNVSIWWRHPVYLAHNLRMKTSNEDLKSDHPKLGGKCHICNYASYTKYLGKSSWSLENWLWISRLLVVRIPDSFVMHRGISFDYLYCR